MFFSDENEREWSLHVYAMASCSLQNGIAQVCSGIPHTAECHYTFM